MPNIYREGAEEGYLEFISMGEIDVDSPIGIASKHKAGTPMDCAAVRSNFFSIGADYPGTAGTTAKRGVIDFQNTHQAVADAAAYGGTANGCLAEKGSTLCVNEFRDSSNALKVSYFIRDNASGVEFGGEAFHIANFLNQASMSNQQAGLSSGDLSGFDYPDLNGGSIDGDERNVFRELRQNNVLGALSVVNDWSANSANGVSTDWVLTMPGQYTMLDLATYTDGFDVTGVTGAEDCIDVAGIACDNRDIPVNINLDIYDREEGSFTPDPGDLVVSPQPPAENLQFTLPREVNVIQWNGETGVLASADPTEVDSDLNPLEADFGWANVSVTSTANPPATCTLQAFFTANGNDGSLIEQGTVTSGGAWVAPGSDGYVCSSVDGDVPVIGMVAWERQVAANPNASYGRIVEHSYVTNS
jgi:hypothetical protein